MDYLAELIKQINDSLSIKIKENADNKRQFEEDNKVLMSAFTKAGIMIKDNNGNFRITEDVLSDIKNKFDQLSF